MKEVNDFLTSAGLSLHGFDSIFYWRKKVHLDNPSEFATVNKDLVGIPRSENIWKKDEE